jgi:hypothetical protein
MIPQLVSVMKNWLLSRLVPWRDRMGQTRGSDYFIPHYCQSLGIMRSLSMSNLSPSLRLLVVGNCAIITAIRTCVLTLVHHKYSVKITLVSNATAPVLVMIIHRFHSSSPRAWLGWKVEICATWVSGLNQRSIVCVCTVHNSARSPNSSPCN